MSDSFKKGDEQVHAGRHADWQVVFILHGQEASPTTSLIPKKLENEQAIECQLVQIYQDQYQHLFDTISTHLPDLILLDTDSLLKSAEPNSPIIIDLFEHLRQIAIEGYRPIIAAIGGNSEEERINWLIKGADDVWDPTLTLDELTIRLLIQLRRQAESNAHPITQLPGLLLTGRILQRRINRLLSYDGEAWALLVIRLDYFEAYQEQYGHLASGQVLRAFSAILIRSVIFPDFIGQNENNDFIVLTHPDKASKIATLLCRQFEAAVPNFYSDRDRKQGYLTSQSEESACRRIPLMSLSIGMASSKMRTYPSFIAAYHSALSMCALSTQSPGNTWTMDTPQLTGEGITLSRANVPILVVESDAAMAYLLTSTLQLDGYPVTAVSSIEDAQFQLSQSEMNGETFQLVILDAMLSGERFSNPHSQDVTALSGLRLCQHIRKQYPNTKILCTSTLHQKEIILRAGADLYLPKPFDMRTLFLWIERLIGSF